MPSTITSANVDTTLTTTLSEVIAAPATGSEKRVNLTICNTGSADATFDLSRYNGTTDRYIGKTVTVSVGKPTVLTDIILKPTYSLRARASAATTLDFTADVLTLTVT